MANKYLHSFIYSFLLVVLDSVDSNSIVTNVSYFIFFLFQIVQIL